MARDTKTHVETRKITFWHKNE